MTAESERSTVPAMRVISPANAMYVGSSAAERAGAMASSEIVTTPFLSNALAIELVQQDRDLLEHLVTAVEELTAAIEGRKL